MQLIQSLQRGDKAEQVLSLFKDIMASGRYAEGAQTEAAEWELSREVLRPAALVNSCGSALYLLFRFLAQQGHTKAVVQNNTFFATGAMLQQAGIQPVLCDSRPDCPSMDLASMMEAVRASGAKLVVLTHVGGWLAKDYEEIARYCRLHEVCLVEDCAHALGVPGAGLLGYAAAWSFYPTKAVPIGDGGALTSADSGLMEYARRFRSYGKYVVEGVIRYQEGMNLRISEWNAAVLRVQLQHLPDLLAARQRDATVLQSIAGCLLQGPSNYYKFPVIPGPWKSVGPVYQLSDQLFSALAPGSFLSPVPLFNSRHWAVSHQCLPVGEGLYDGMTPDQVRHYLQEA